MENTMIYKLVFQSSQEYACGNDVKQLAMLACRQAYKSAGRVSWAVYHRNGRCVASGFSRNRRFFNLNK